MTTPASQYADGNVKVTWVPTIADPAEPTTTELNAVGAVDLTCYLTPDGFAPTTEQASVNDDRLCSTETFELPGRTTNTLMLTYIYRAQDTVGTDNKAFTTLKDGTTGYIVARWGADYEDVYAADDVVNVTPVTAGVQMEMPAEANSTLKINQKLFVRGAMQRQVAVVAGA